MNDSVPASSSAASSPPPSTLGAVRCVALAVEAGVRHLRRLPWSRLDREGTEGVDRLIVSRPGCGGSVKIAVADVVGVSPLLADLASGVASLDLDEDRVAIVVELQVGDDRIVRGSDRYRAIVLDRGRLSSSTVVGAAELGVGDHARVELLYSDAAGGHVEFGRCESTLPESDRLAPR